MKTSSKILTFICIGFFAASCSENRTKNETATVFSSALKGVFNRQKGQAVPPALTRAALAGFSDPLIRATLEGGQSAFLGVSSTNGSYQVWRDASGISLTLRNGILVATKGLGGDLESSAAPSIINGARNTKHILFYIDGSEATQENVYDCSVNTVSRENITILEKTYSTKKIIETCRNDASHFQNEFWVDTHGKIRQSKQFVSNSVGFISLQRLID